MSVTTTSTDRNCPQCGALNASDAVRCGCGFLFAAAIPDGGGLVAQAEALYEYYLSTRLARAVKAIKTARIELLRDPENPARANALKQAEDEVRMLRAQLASQAARAAQAQSGVTATDSATTAPKAGGTLAPTTAFSEMQAARAVVITEGARPNEAMHSLGDKSAAEFAVAQNQRAERIAREQSQSRALETNPRPFISDDELAALRRPSAFSSKG
jgi:hypothetical protein